MSDWASSPARSSWCGFSRDPTPAPGQAADQWWTASQSRLIVLWAVTEGACLVNATLWFITQARVSLVAAALALAVLFVLRPGRYLE